jgi:transposase-like protein
VLEKILVSLSIQNLAAGWKITSIKRFHFIACRWATTNISGQRTCLNGAMRKLTTGHGVVRIFPNKPSCLRLIRALAAETHENCIEAHRYLDMGLLKKHRKIH